jgi:hypothetical protein
MQYMGEKRLTRACFQVKQIKLAIFSNHSIKKMVKTAKNQLDDYKEEAIGKYKIIN